jgi:hypothetical protein
VRNTVATARILPIDYSVSLMTPYFGTVMRDEFIEKGFYKDNATFKQYNGYTGIIRTEGLSFEEVTLAHAWASAELELVTRERQLAKAKGPKARAIQAARVAKQRFLTEGLRSKAAAREKQNQAALAAATS